MYPTFSAISAMGGGRKGLWRCGSPFFLVRYCGFTRLGGFRFLPILGRGNRWKNGVWGVSRVTFSFRSSGDIWSSSFRLLLLPCGLSFPLNTWCNWPLTFYRSFIQWYVHFLQDVIKVWKSSDRISSRSFTFSNICWTMSGRNDKLRCNFLRRRAKGARIIARKKAPLQGRQKREKAREITRNSLVSTTVTG